MNSGANKEMMEAIYAFKCTLPAFAIDDLEGGIEVPDSILVVVDWEGNEGYSFFSDVPNNMSDVFWAIDQVGNPHAVNRIWISDRFDGNAYIETDSEPLAVGFNELCSNAIEIRKAMKETA